MKVIPKIFTMQDRSTSDTPLDENLSYEEMLEMVDWTEEQLAAVKKMPVGASFIFDHWIYIERVQ